MVYTIAVDLDETLSNTMQAFFGLYNRHVGGKHFKWEDITAYHISQIQWVLLTDAEQSAMTNKMFLEHPELVIPREWSRERIQQRYEEGHHLYVVSGRPLIFKELTSARIEKYFPWVFKDIFLCNHFFGQPVEGPVTTKGEICKRIDAHIMIDDDKYYAADTAGKGIKTFLFDRPWNQDFDVSLYPSIQRVFGWEEIEL